MRTVNAPPQCVTLARQALTLPQVIPVEPRIDRGRIFGGHRTRNGRLACLRLGRLHLLFGLHLLLLCLA